MNAHSIVIVLVIVLTVTRVGYAQYPGEICHWECQVSYCDYYQDYCDYDCFEICLPYLPNTAPDQSELPTLLPMSNLRQLSVSSTRSQQRQQTASSGSESKQNVRTGKVVKMKIKNLSFEIALRGQVVMAKGSTPRVFSMFQDCLSKIENCASARKTETERKELKNVQLDQFKTDDGFDVQILKSEKDVAIVKSGILKKNRKS